MDICNMKSLASLYAGQLGTATTEAITLPPALTVNDVKDAQMTTARVRELSQQLKLDGNTVLRLNDMIV